MSCRIFDQRESISYHTLNFNFLVHRETFKYASVPDPNFYIVLFVFTLSHVCGAFILYLGEFNKMPPYFLDLHFKMDQYIFVPVSATEALNLRIILGTITP